MAKVKITVKQRDSKKKPKTLIREEIIPGVVYDQKTNSELIGIPLGDLKQFLLDAREGQLVELTIKDKNPKTAVFKELQMDVRANTPSHVSFMILDDKKIVDMPVRIVLDGEAPAVKNSLGVMIQTLNAIELRGLPKDFPNSLSINVTSLEEVGDSLDILAIKIPEKLEFVRDEDKELTVVTIRPYQKAIEEEKPEVVEGEELIEGEEIPEGGVPAEGEEGETPAEEEEAVEGEETKEGEKPVEGDKKVEGKKPKKGSASLKATPKLRTKEGHKK